MALVLAPVADCRVCGTEAVVTHRGKLLARHEVTYYRCPECEFWFTEEPYWLDEAYFHISHEIDEGLVQRNLTMARQLGVLLPRLFPEGPYVDWASGSGLLVRLMRDAGFEFYWQDKYADNVLAREFNWDEASDRSRRAKFVSAIEVLEHTPYPMDFVRDVLDVTGAPAIFFTEHLHDGVSYDPSWWYLLPDSGQHISFYSAKTLQAMAGLLGLSVQSWGSNHVLTRDPLPEKALRRALRSSRAITYVSRTPGRMSVAPSSLAWHVATVRRRLRGS